MSTYCFHWKCIYNRLEAMGLRRKQSFCLADQWGISAEKIDVPRGIHGFPDKPSLDAATNYTSQVTCTRFNGWLMAVITVRSFFDRSRTFENVLIAIGKEWSANGLCNKVVSDLLNSAASNMSFWYLGKFFRPMFRSSEIQNNYLRITDGWNFILVAKRES